MDKQKKKEFLELELKLLRNYELEELKALIETELKELNIAGNETV